MDPLEQAVVTTERMSVIFEESWRKGSVSVEERWAYVSAFKKRKESGNYRQGSSW